MFYVKAVKLGDQVAYRLSVLRELLQRLNGSSCANSRTWDAAGFSRRMYIEFNTSYQRYMSHVNFESCKRAAAVLLFSI